MPSGIVLEKPGRNLDSLTQTTALQALQTTLIHEWKIRHAFTSVEKFGIRPTTMALFHGPPGNGKTMASKMLASVIDAPLYRVSCEGLLHAYLGKSEQNTRAIVRTMQVFWQAIDRWETPQIFLLATNRIEDIDEALLSRCETKLEFLGPTREQAELVLSYWSEILHEHGAQIWSPVLSKQIGRKTPASFRELWQSICQCVRQWIIQTKQGAVS